MYVLGQLFAYFFCVFETLAVGVGVSVVMTFKGHVRSSVTSLFDRSSYDSMTIY